MLFIFYSDFFSGLGPSPSVTSRTVPICHLYHFSVKSFIFMGKYWIISLSGKGVDCD